MIRAYTQSVAILNLLRAFATRGYAAMQRVNQWNLDFTDQSEQGDRYRELAHRVDEAMGFMAVAGLTVDYPIMESKYSAFLLLHFYFLRKQECVDIVVAHLTDGKVEAGENVTTVL
ncbi:hypothetical protein T459_01355 [Capsicum annuum]|uniref:Phospho-2-dehydro-3-deoxyheptonate aldolase n=1 Tax=Capsicum annuum TaxID=4072 RepID=A0A2G3AH31_CAPAN|nr:hypothetical protein T459_01355 [Capsicum annuum]